MRKIFLAEMELMRTSITKHLGRKLAQHARGLMMDITAVDIGIKPAYLYDVGQPSGEKLTALLQDLKQQNLIRNNFNVLEIGMDCLIVNVEEMKQNAFLFDFNERLVDVSGALNNPCICSDRNVAFGIEEDLHKLIQLLDCSKVKHLSACSLSCNITSMFGVILNYPLVYWYDSHDGKGDNCLSMEKLTSVKVYINCIQKNGQSPKSAARVYNHCLYSFSYPSCINSLCRPFVDQWLGKLRDKVQDQNIFSDVRITFDEIVLEAVCL